VTEEEIAAIADVRKEPVDQVWAMYSRGVHAGRTLREKSNGDCVFFERGLGCTVYEARPRQCRTWPFWQSTAGTPEAWDRTKSICPGSGRGEWVSADEITRRINVIKL
jgi:Fe-S-cluster containining protein